MLPFGGGMSWAQQTVSIHFSCFQKVRLHVKGLEAVILPEGQLSELVDGTQVTMRLKVVA